MIHNQFCQSSSRPHIPHHFKWPSSIFQVAENVCHEIIRGSFHCKIRKSTKDSDGVSRTGSEVDRSIFGGWTRTLNAFSLLDTLFLVFHQFIRWTQFVTDFTKQRNSAVVFTFGLNWLSCESELVKLSGVRTISLYTPSISSTTRGIWESSVSPRRWHSHWWASSSSSHNWSFSD